MRSIYSLPTKGLFLSFLLLSQALWLTIPLKGLCYIPYRYDIVARTGEKFREEGVIVALGWGPSINDTGNVAFSGQIRVPEQGPDTAKEGIFVWDGNRLERRSALVNSFYYNKVARITHLDTAFHFSNVVQINNQDQVVWNVLARDNLFAFILRLGPTAQDFKIIAKKYYPRIDNPDLEAKSPFSYLYPWVTINNRVNNQSRVVFSGTPTMTAKKVLCTPRNTETGGHDLAEDYYLWEPGDSSFELFPMVTDNNYTLVKAGGAPSNPLLLYPDETFRFPWWIAYSPPFTAIGSKPGLSDDSRPIVFMGDHEALGVGIFGEIGSIFKIAGVSHDGYRDPGEAHCDLNGDHKVDPNEDIGAFCPYQNQLPFDPVPRVGVNRSNAGISKQYTAVYLANGCNKQEQLDPVGLYTSRIDLTDLSKLRVSAPWPIIIAGEKIGNLPGVVNEIKLYDPINNNGQVAFWVRTSEDVEAIVRASPSVCVPIQSVYNLSRNGVFDLVARKDMVIRIFFNTGLRGPTLDAKAIVCVDGEVDNCDTNNRRFQTEGRVFPLEKEFTQEEMRQAANSLNVFIKGDYANRVLTQGEHIFEVKVIADDAGAFPDWEYSFKGFFRESKRLNIFVIPIALRDENGNLVGPEDSTESGLDDKDAPLLEKAADLLKVIFPVDEEDIEIKVLERMEYEESHGDPDPYKTLFNKLNEYFEKRVLLEDKGVRSLYDEVDPGQNFIVGVVNSNIGKNNAPLGRVNGVPRLGYTYTNQDVPKAVVTLDRIPQNDPNSSSIARPGKILLGYVVAHEIGHLFDFVDDYCKAPPFRGKYNFSHPGYKDELGTAAGFYILGDDLAFDVSGLRPKMKARDEGEMQSTNAEARPVFYHEMSIDPIAEGAIYSFMGGSGRSCGTGGLGKDQEGASDVRTWTRRENYKHLYNNMTTNNNLNAAQRFSAHKRHLRQVILISGYVSKDGAASFDHFTVANTDSAFPRPQGSQYDIEFIDPAGALLDKVSFDVSFILDTITDGFIPVEEAPFVFIVDLPENTRSISMLQQGSLLETFTASPSPPVISIISAILAADALTVKWDAYDPDGDLPVLDVIYSPNGIDRFVLVIDIKGKELKRILHDFPQAEEGARIILYACDDFNSTEVSCLLTVMDICPGDFDKDGDVDGSDLAVFATNFGRTDCLEHDLSICDGDFDLDGDVDGSDLSVFAGDFGKTDCPSYP